MFSTINTLLIPVGFVGRLEEENSSAVVTRAPEAALVIEREVAGDDPVVTLAVAGALVVNWPEVTKEVVI